MIHRTCLSAISFLLIFAVITGAARAESNDGWVSLFDGKSLEGWILKNGTATYRVEDGTIIGKTKTGSPNSFLCTEKEYADFELEFEVKVHDKLNSGVQIRSKTKELPTRKKKQNAFGRVYGPQVEIEASGQSGAEAGYVYGEATGRGWLTPKERLIPHKHFRDGQWNHYRIVAKGPRIQTWINGKPIEDIADSPIYETHPSGFIGLQVHGIAKDAGPYDVAWRNIRIKELNVSSSAEHSTDNANATPDNRLSVEEQTAGWKLLFNGKDTTDWKNSNDKPVLACVEDGTLNPYKSGGHLLVYDKPFGDFVLRCDVKMDKVTCNSGIFFRVGSLNNPVQTGLEMQVEGGKGVSRHGFGSIYDLIAPSENASNGPREWDAVEIQCKGPLVSVKVNGKTVNNINCDDFTQPGKCLDGSKNKYKNAIKDFPRKGYLGFQAHGHDVWYKNVKLLELE